MQNNVISLVYYITAVICLTFFIYMLTDNSLTKDKKIFSVLIFAGMACCYSSSQFLISGDRFSAVLYSSITLSALLVSCVALLHFFMINIYSAINGKVKFLLSVFYIISILYLPAFFMFYINLYKNLSFLEFKEYLWNVSREASTLKIVAFPMVLVILITSLVLIIRGRERDFLINEKKKMDHYFVTVIALIVATIVDFCIRLIFIEPILPVLTLTMMVFVIYQLCLYGYGRYLAGKKEIVYNVYIVDTVFKNQLYCVVSCLIGIISATLYGIQIIFNGKIELKYAICNLSCVVISICVTFAQTKIKNENISDIISNILWAALIPIIIYGFLGKSAITIGMIPIIFMLIGCVFITKRFIVIFGVTGVLSFIAIAIMNPRNVILFKMQDHIFRIVVLIGVCIIIMFIHLIFVKRLYEVNKHELFQMAIVNISSGLIASVDKDIDDRFKEAIEDIMEFTDSVRVFVYRFSEDQNTLNLVCYSEKDKSYRLEVESRINSYDLSEKYRYLVKDNIITFDHAKIEEYQYLRMNSVSSIYIPMRDKEKVIGVLILQSLQSGHYMNFDKKLLRLLSDMLSNALTSAENDRLLAHNSVYDTLTQLRNRAGFTEMLNYRIERIGDGQQLTVVFIDLDAFKEINDLQGHDFGDKILVEVSRRFTELLGKDAIVSRFGGDEFLLMFNDFDNEEEIGNKLNALMSSFLNPIIIDKNEVHLTMSCGIAIYPKDGNDAVTLISNADMAMNQAKQNGKNRYVFCSEDMKDKIKRRAFLTESLRKALDNSEFKVVYQPQVDAKTHKIRAAEALLRWFPKDSEELGKFVSPGEFIPILEETGLILEVGRFVMEESIKLLHTLSQIGVNSFMIAVNMSTTQFKDLSFVNFIDEKLKKYDVRPDQIDVEVTEGAYGDEYSNISFLLGELQNLGVKVSIDDFGTGYSNMSRLSHISIDKIKIDMSFVRGIGINFKDEGIIKTIIKLTQSLGCVTLAEGVETEEQLNFLAENGCQLIQGYYFYKPLPADEFLSVIKNEFNIKEE